MKVKTSLIAITFCAVAYCGEDITSRTPLALSPGAPAGSYPLSDFDTVNLYSGNLSVHLPILTVTGRGEARYTMYVNLERHFWIDTYAGTGPDGYTYQVITNQRPDTFGFLEAISPPMYSPGFLYARGAGGGSQSCPSETQVRYGSTLTRLTFIGADGTETELIDQLHGASPLIPSACATGTTGPERGQVFVSRDGTATTFVSDAPIRDNPYVADTVSGIPYQYPSGWLFFRSGVKYRISSGRVELIKDRNGNFISLFYTPSCGASQACQLSTIVDSIGRTITVDTSNGDQHVIHFPGLAGNDRTIKVNFGYMDANCGGCTPQTYPVLFRPDYAPLGVLDPVVVSSIVLPDSRQYTFTYNTYAEVTSISLPIGGKVSYTYGPGDGNSSVVIWRYTTPTIAHVYRRVLTRTVSHDGSSIDEVTTVRLKVEQNQLVTGIE